MFFATSLLVNELGNRLLMEHAAPWNGQRAEETHLQALHGRHGATHVAFLIPDAFPTYDFSQRELVLSLLICTPSSLCGFNCGVDLHHF